MPTWAVGDATITRVEDPGFELVLPQDEATVATLRSSPWLAPHFVTDDWSLVVGSTATVIRAGDRTIVVDPFLAFDDPERLDARLGALRDAGCDPADVDVVVNTHVDGIGVNVAGDGTPAFPNARYLLPREELDALRDDMHEDARGAPFVALADDGTAVGSDGTEELAPGVRLEPAPGHNRGHHAVWIEDGGDAAVVVGHLFLHPAQIANPEVSTGEPDPALLARTRRSLLARCRESGATLIGPLFAAPGGGTVAGDDATGWRLDVDS
jgi:glyoxylase-like metal-dependent hydrolase (beta-lactamase superfamily II)